MDQLQRLCWSCSRLLSANSCCGSTLQRSTCDHSCVPARPHETASSGGTMPPWGTNASAVAAAASGNLIVSSTLQAVMPSLYTLLGRTLQAEVWQSSCSRGRSDSSHA